MGKRRVTLVVPPDHQRTFYPVEAKHVEKAFAAREAELLPRLRQQLEMEINIDGDGEGLGEFPDIAEMSGKCVLESITFGEMEGVPAAHFYVACLEVDESDCYMHVEVSIVLRADGTAAIVQSNPSAG